MSVQKNDRKSIDEKIAYLTKFYGKVKHNIITIVVNVIGKLFDGKLMLMYIIFSRACRIN